MPAALTTASMCPPRFATADAIRDELKAAGVVLEDTADGARWTLEN